MEDQAGRASTKVPYAGACILGKEGEKSTRLECLHRPICMCGVGMYQLGD